MFHHVPHQSRLCVLSERANEAGKHKSGAPLINDRIVSHVIQVPLATQQATVAEVTDDLPDVGPPVTSESSYAFCEGDRFVWELRMEKFPDC